MINDKGRGENFGLCEGRKVTLWIKKKKKYDAKTSSWINEH